MSLKDILSISGIGGLHKVVAQTKNGFVVESLVDKKRTAINQTHKVSMLNDISVFSVKEEKPLKEVLLLMKEKNGDQLPVTPKSEPSELKKYFKSVFPDYDEERVYVSDIKKIISWYPLIKDVISKEEEQEAVQEKQPEAATGNEKANDGNEP